ncbi:UNVERIFIED_ORG: hypothetical protein ABIC97_004137 [Peribacillus simplex]
MDILLESIERLFSQTQKQKIAEVPLPSPYWAIDEEGCWKDQYYISKKKNRTNKDCSVK